MSHLPWPLKISLVFAGVLALAFVLLGFGVPGKFVLGSFILTMAASVYFLLLSFRTSYVSPYALVLMYVKGLAEGKYDPPLPENGASEVRQLARALNSLAQSLKTQNEMIEELERVRIEFVANVSHELKTPLTSIRGYTETLKGGATRDPEASQKFLTRIEDNANRLSALISDLLDLSRYEKFPHELEWDSFQGSSVTKKLEEMFFPVLSKKNQKLEISTSNKTWEGDRPKLEQAFINLIDNASRYTQEGSRIRLRQTSDKDYFIFEVSDNGPGIPEKHLPRLFERFYRVDKARSRETGGTGLGLSIVKHIVQSHGGSVQVSSRINEGTSFIIKIPRRHVLT